MYVDTDVVLAHLKVNDWLSSEVEITKFEDPVTSTATAIEVQYVMEDEWSREQLAGVHQEIGKSNIDLIPLSEDVLDEASTIRISYPRVNVFDSVHLGSTIVADVPIISTDTLYPEIDEIDHIDPREI